VRWPLLLVALGCGKHASVEHRDRTSAVVTITASLPGASSTMVESAVAAPLEDAVARIHGLAHLRTRIASDHVVIVVELDASIDPYVASQDVHAAVAGVQKQLPADTMPPTVMVAAPRELAVLRYTLRGDGPPTAIARWQDEVAARALETLPGVARIASCGGVTERWTIAVDPIAVSSRGKGLDAVITALEAHTLDLRPPTIDELRADPLVRETTMISESVAPPSCRAVDRSGPAVVVSVSAQLGADPLAVREALEAKLRELVTQLPPSVQLEVLPRMRPIAFTIGGVTPATLDHVRAALAGVAGVEELVVELGATDATTADVRLVPRDGESESTVESAARTALAAAHLTVRDRTQTIVKVSGPDLAELRRIAEGVAGAFEGRVTERLGLDDTPRLVTELDRDRLASLGVAANVVTDALRVLDDDGWPIRGSSNGPPIVLTLHTEATGFDRLRLIQVTSATLGLVSLDQVVRLKQGQEPPVILRDDRARWVGVRLAATADEIHAVVDKLAIPPGMRITLAAAE